MKNKKIFVVILALFVLLIVGASVLYTQLSKGQKTDQLQVEQPQTSTTETSSEPDSHSSEPVQTETETQPPLMEAPDFTVYDENGNEIHLSDFFGKPIVLNFWASWCGPCRSEMADFDAAFQKMGDQVQFLMVNATDGSRETVDTASAFVKNHGFSFPVFYDVNQNAAQVYRTYSLPTTYFITADGKLAARAMGAIDADTLLQGIGIIIP